MNRRRIRREDISKALLILSLLLFLVAAGGFFISRWENARYATAGGAGDVRSESIFSQESITVDGITYTKNNKVRSYLIMGCDNDNEPVTHEHGGQADMQVLVIVDDAAKTWRLMPIDRDTVVSMDVYDADYNYVGSTNAQLTLVHAYRSWEDGAKETVKTVSNMLGGQKIDGYLSTNMDSIAVINDALGGVPVTITTDFTNIDDSLVLGEEIVLNGEQAKTFVRSRRNVDDGTNESRMKRQEVYFNGMVRKIQGLSNGEVLEIYDKLVSNSVTNIGSGDFVELAEMTKEYTRLDNIQIDGTHELVGEHIRFYQNEDSLNHVILELFYTPEAKS